MHLSKPPLCILLLPMVAMACAEAPAPLDVSPEELDESGAGKADLADATITVSGLSDPIDPDPVFDALRNLSCEGVALNHSFGPGAREEFLRRCRLFEFDFTIVEKTESIELQHPRSRTPVTLFMGVEVVTPERAYPVLLFRKYRRDQGRFRWRFGPRGEVLTDAAYLAELARDVGPDLDPGEQLWRFYLQPIDYDQLPVKIAAAVEYHIDELNRAKGNEESHAELGGGSPRAIERGFSFDVDRRVVGYAVPINLVSAGAVTGDVAYFDVAGTLIQ